MSLSLDGKKSLSINVKDRNPKIGNDADSNIALLGREKAQCKNFLY
jgi:hypothetical protein